MSTRKRKQDEEEEEELQALPSDVSEEEEEYVHQIPSCCLHSVQLQLAMTLASYLRASIRHCSLVLFYFMVSLLTASSTFLLYI